jgi:hypothetical protein
LAEENEDLRAAQQAFEGDAFREGEVHKDPAGALLADFDSMLQAGEFDVLAKALYQPLLIWTERKCRCKCWIVVMRRRRNRMSEILQAAAFPCTVRV